MKVLNINSYYYSSTVHRELQLGLLRNNIDSCSFVPVHHNYSPRPECNYGYEEGINKAVCFNKKDRMIFQVKHKKIYNELNKQYNLNQYNILHAHSLFSNGYIAFKVKKEYDIPYIVTVRDTDVNTFFNKMFHLRKLGNEILLNADAIIFLSQPYMKVVIENYVSKNNKEIIKNKCHIVPNGINKYWLDNRINFTPPNNKNQISIVHVGEISKRKNLITTLKAVESLIERGYKVDLTSVGKITNNKIYESIKNNKLIKFVPQQSKKGLIDIYRNSDILVVPSITETFGLVYPEAMSQGLPVIYSRGQGFDGQFPEGTVGYSTDCYDENEIAEKIIKIINNYGFFSKNSTNLSNNFSWENITNTYKNIYKAIYRNNQSLNEKKDVIK